MAGRDTRDKLCTLAMAVAMLSGVGLLPGELLAQTGMRDPLRPHPYTFAKVLQDKPNGGEPAVVDRVVPPPKPDGLDTAGPKSGFSEQDGPMHALSSDPLGEPSACGDMCGSCCPPRSNWLANSSLFLIFDGFSNQLEPQTAVAHGNFGNRLGGYTAVSLNDCWGMSLEGGASAGWYDYRGTNLAGVGSRFQNFWTAAFSQRLFCDQVAWGFAHDWLYDDYLVTPARLSQWRTKLAWQANPCDQYGLWVSVADRGSQVTTAGALTTRFRPFTQGVAYWQHEWHSHIATQLYVGKAAFPGDWTFGSTANVPLSEYLALYANGNYILPHREPAGPGTGEVWNISVGLQFYPGSAMRPNDLSHRPLFNLVDNATMAIRRY